MSESPSSGQRDDQASGHAPSQVEPTFAQVVRELSDDEKALLRTTGRSEKVTQAIAAASSSMATSADQPGHDPRVPHLPVILPKATTLMAWRARKALSRELGMLRISKRGLPPVELPDKPVLVYCNVASPWARELAMLLAWRYWPSLRHYSPLPRSHASRYGLKFKAGFFPVTETPKGLRKMMRTAREVLSCPGHVLWMGATAQVTDVRIAPPEVNKVVTQLVRKAQDIILLPLAVEHPYWKSGRPDAMVRFGRPVQSIDAGKRTASGWQQLLARRLQMTQHRLAEEVMEGDAGAFEEVAW